MSKSGSEEQDKLPITGAFRNLARVGKVGKLLFFGLAALLLIVLAITLFPDNRSTRTESYRDASGAAGLDAVITHNGKPVSNFNVYIFRDDGQQVGVVRPDKEGRVRMAQQEGNYVMLIGKQFDDNMFPQEPLILKNGKTLELKLKY